MANTKISALTALTNPTWNEEFVYAYNNANGKITLDTMKTFVWWSGITTLNADANIWELNEGIYETTYDLYYISWETVPAVTGWGSTRKQMLFVTKESTGERWFLVFNVWYLSPEYSSYAAFGYSISSSVWEMYRLGAWDASLKRYGSTIGNTLHHPDALWSSTLTQIITEIDDSSTNDLRVGSRAYAWVTYTILVSSVKSGQTYTISLWTWVTNPLNITLPSASNKKCVITLLATSTTTAVVTGCTIEN